MTISIKPTASGSTIEQDGSTILTVDSSGNIAVSNNLAITGTTTPTGNLYPKVPAFSARALNSQTFSAGAWTKIVFDVEEFDTNSNYDNTTNYRYTPTVAGYYQVNLGFKIEPVTNRGIVALYKNGGLYKLGNDVQATYTRNLTGSFLVYCNGSTDYIEAYAYHGGGGSSNVSSSLSHQTHFQGHLVSV